MRNLLYASDQDRLAAYFHRRADRTVALGGRTMTALAEGDAETSTYSASDNARAAELLALPGIHDAAPWLTDASIDFAMAMADTPMPCRRVGNPTLVVQRDEPRDFVVLTPFHVYTGDLSVGVVHQRLRGQMEAVAAVTHSSSLLEFRIGHRRTSMNAAAPITAFGMSREGEELVMWHESRVMGCEGWMRTREVEAGRLRYEYAISAISPLLCLSVTFAAATTLRAVQVTTAVDGLCGSGFAEGAVQAASGWRRFAAPRKAGSVTWAEKGLASHIAVATDGWWADGPALHLRPADPSAVISVKATVPKPGYIDSVLLRHRPRDVAAGASLVVREDRFLSTGLTGPDAAYAMTVSQHALPGALDLQPVAPQGAILNAIGTHLLFASARAYRSPISGERKAALAAWFDAHLARLRAGEPTLEDLSQATLGVEARLRAEAHPDYAAALRDLASRLLAMQGDDGAFFARDGNSVGLAEQALALLAMARALPQLDPSRVARAIAAALAAVRPGRVELVAAPRRFWANGLLVGGVIRQSEFRYAEGVALMARAAGAVTLAAAASPGVLAREAIDQAEKIHRHAVSLLRKLVWERDGMLEVVPSPLGGAPNPTTQAAAMLGLMAPDGLIREIAASTA